MTSKLSTTLKLLLWLSVIAAITFPLGVVRAGQGITNRQLFATSQSNDALTGFETVKAKLTFETSAYTVGDVIPLTLQVTHPAGYRMIPLQLEGAWGDFEVRSLSVPQVSVNPDGSETTTQIIEVRLWAPGEFNTPELGVSVSDTDGEVGQVSAAPISMNISSVLVEGDSNLRDLKPQAELPLPPLWPWVVGGLLLVAAAIVLVIWLLRRRQSHQQMVQVDIPDLRTPSEVALDELERIQTLKLPEQERYKEHYTLVSDVLRHYLENAFHIPTLDRTTGEIRTSLKYSTLTQVHKAVLVDSLMLADLVKFAKLVPELDQALEYLPKIRQLVTETVPPAPIYENKNGHKHEDIGSVEHTAMLERDS